jgi:SAM-dependent methyltransferase
LNCEVCGESAGKRHLFREMMFGSREEFEYWECLGCGCLQIAEVPPNLADYYPEGYYSFSMKFSSGKAWFYRLHQSFPRLMRRMRPLGVDVAGVFATDPRRGARILDVGSGSGRLVETLRSVDFDAWGIDPFLRTEQPHLRRSSIEEVEGGWDLIMFHHSLEHMKDHCAVLRRVHDKLASGGRCLVRIPVANWAWQQYGRDWVQLDAPRHLVVHTPKSLQIAARSAGFEVIRTIFDSNEFQIVGSELYRRNLPFFRETSGEDDRRSPQELRRLRARAEQLNREQQGDQAAFVLADVSDSKAA